MVSEVVLGAEGATLLRAHSAGFPLATVMEFFPLKQVYTCGKSELDSRQVNNRNILRAFPGSPVANTSPSTAEGEGSIPGRRAKILHVSRSKNQNMKQKQCCNKFTKDFKNGPDPPPQKKNRERKRKTLTNDKSGRVLHG